MLPSILGVHTYIIYIGTTDAAEELDSDHEREKL